MNRFLIRSVVSCVLALILCVPTVIARDVVKFYAENCANCHGKNLEGGQSSSLLDDEWKHGGDDASIARNIAEGFPTNGMPPWKTVLDDADIRALVVFIRERATRAKESKMTFAKPVDGQVIQSREHTFRFATVAEGFDTPWSMAFLPDGRMLVTELSGRLRIIDHGKLLPEPVIGTPKVRYQQGGQGGLMDVVIHPDYKNNGWIYLSYSDQVPGTGSETLGMTAVVRGRIKENHWVDEQTIFRAPPDKYLPGPLHFGSRLVLDGKGYLFFSIGERFQKEHAQDITRPNGKIHRVHDDGRIPADNPFTGQSNAVASIWSYGHRNPQGLDQNPATGESWETEHGPRGGDELNLIQRGRNYGWPVITYGMDYNGSPISAFTEKEGLEQPVIHWTPSIAVCGMDFYEGDKFPRWKNNLFVTALAQQELRRLVIVGHKVTEQEVLFKDIGRLRDVTTGPDGCVYVAFNKPDRIVRLEPASAESTPAIAPVASPVK